MNKEAIKFLWDIYNELLEKQNSEDNEYGIDASDVVKKLKARIDLELKENGA